MRLLYFLQSDEHTGGRTAGERLAAGLARATDMEVVTAVGEPLGIDNEAPFVEDGGHLVPTGDLAAAVGAVGPDAVVVHGVSGAIIEVMPVINAMATTVLRAGLNLTESHLNGYDSHLEAVPPFVRSFDAVWSPAPVTTERLVSMGVDRGRIHGVGVAAGHGPEPVRHGERPLAVGCASRSAKVKDLPALARALRWYEDEIGGAPRVVLATNPPGGSDEEPAVVRHARALSVEHLFEYVGWADPFEEVYPRVRAVVVPSLSENRPAVYSEALSAGVPVVEPRAAWSEGPGRYEPGSPASMARAIARAVDAPAELLAEQRSRMPEAVRLSGAVRAAEETLRETVSRCGRFKMGVGA